MIRRSTLVFLTSLIALTISGTGLSAQDLLIAQSSVVDPASAVNTGEAIPNFQSDSSESPLQDATSEQQQQELKILQQELKNRGYYDGPVDGIYGPMTEEAIRTLRGQQTDQAEVANPPRLFTPDSAVQGSNVPETPTESPQLPDADNSPDQAQTEDSAVRINAENTTVDDEGITIGDQVTSETGAEDLADGPAATQTESPSEPPSATQPAPGLGRLLWPGLALIAIFSSFGIGFALANRPKTTADSDTESPWGDVPDTVPQLGHHPASNVALNGNGRNGTTHTATNITHGIGALAEPDRLVQPDQPHHSLPVVSTSNNVSNVSATTRLVKADVMDELVASLQVADPSKRRKAIWELGQRGNSSAVQHLVNSMVDADSKEKSLILAALSEIGIRSLKPMNRALAIALQDENPDVRKNAIRDLTRVYELVTQISQMLGHATEDHDPEVRRTAEWALEQLNRIREAPKLKSSLSTLEASRSTPELLTDDIENSKN